LKTGNDEQLYLTRDELTILLTEIYNILEEQDFSTTDFEDLVPEIKIPRTLEVLEDGWETDLETCREIYENIVKNPVTGLYRKSHFVDTILPSLTDSRYRGVYFFDITGLKVSNEGDSHGATDVYIEEIVKGIKRDITETYGVEFNDGVSSDAEEHILNLGSGRFMVLTRESYDMEGIVAKWKKELSISPLGLAYASIDMLGFSDGVNITESNFVPLITALEERADFNRRQNPDDIRKKFYPNLLRKYINKVKQIYKEMVQQKGLSASETPEALQQTRNELARRVVNALLESNRIVGYGDNSWYMPDEIC